MVVEVVAEARIETVAKSFIVCSIEYSRNLPDPGMELECSSLSFRVFQCEERIEIVAK